MRKSLARPPLPRLPPSLLPHFHLDSDQDTLEGSGLYLSASGCSARPGVKQFNVADAGMTKEVGVGWEFRGPEGKTQPLQP